MYGLSANVFRRFSVRLVKIEMVGQMEVPTSNVVHGTGYGITGAATNGNSDDASRLDDEPLFQNVYELCEIIGKGPFSLVR